jgi:DNA-directed RNA polymerase subunit F
MAGIEILSENPVTLSEVKAMIEEVKKRDKEIPPRTTKTHEYVTLFGKKKEKEVQKQKEELEKLGISRLKPRHLVKIIDLNPKDMDSLRLILTGENLTLKQEDMEKIIEVMKK